MHFGTKALLEKSQNPSLKINGIPLDHANNYRYLGMSLDTNLNFKIHTKTLLRSVNFKNYLFRNIRLNLPKHAALKVVKCMILPVIDYADTIYMVTTATLLKNLQNAFNRGLKTAYMNQRDTIESLQRESKIGTLERRRIMHMNSASFKASLDNNLIDPRDIRTRAHDARMLVVNRPRDPFYRRSLEYRLATNWNDLHHTTRVIDNKVTFHGWNNKDNQDHLPPPEP